MHCQNLLAVTEKPAYLIYSRC